MKKILLIINSLMNEFIYGGHLLSLGGSSVAYTASVLLNIKITPEFILIIYVGLQAIYLYDRYADIKHDNLTNPERTKYLAKNFEKMPLIILCFILVFFIILCSSGNMKALIFGSILIFSSFLYNLFLKKITKKIVAFKDFFVSICWASITIFLALYYYYSFNKTLFLVFLFVFMVLFANVNFCNIKDIEGDKKKNLLTLAVIFGKEKLLKILCIIIIISITPLIYGIYFNLLPKSALALFFIIPYTFCYFNKSTKEKIDLAYLTNTLVYGEYILWSVLIFMGKTLL